MLELGTIVPIILDRKSKSCLVIAFDGRYSVILSGKYYEDETMPFKIISNEEKIPSMIRFDEQNILFENIILSNEIKEIYSKIRILTEHLGFMEVSKKEFKNITNDLIKKCRIKKNIGFKPTIIDFKKASFDFVLDNIQFSLQGPLEEKSVMIDDLGNFCFKIENKNIMLSYLLDSIYIDLSSVMSFESSSDMIKQMSHSLISDHNYKITESYTDTCKPKRK